jgi:hypothetical protein
MKRLIITTAILIIAAVAITVVYFKNLNPQGQRTSRVIHNIPDNAAIIFEFNNETGFYDIFKDNQLFTSVIGKQAIADLDTLQKQLLLNPLLEQYFSGQNIFISVHPLKNNNVDFLLTTSATSSFNVSMIDKLTQQKDNDLLITPTNMQGKKGYVIYSNILKKRFYLVSKEDDIFSGSFSKELAFQSAQYVPKRDEKTFVPLPDQQNTNSLGNLYVNYNQLNPLFEQLFQNKNTDIFKSFRLFQGLSALSLNFKSDALMFNGSTTIEKDKPESYLNLFNDQQPVVNQLKNIFPSSTAYSIDFAISNVTKFKSDLSGWQAKAGLQNEKDALFKQIKTETGENVIAYFNELLANEFAVITTRYHEKFAIIGIKDGSKLKKLMNNLGKIISDNTGQLNYDKLPYFLLGDPFNIFKRPYFMIIDNYLILANSDNELKSFYDSYINSKFLSKIDQYNQFDNLLAERSNITYFINFKNAGPLLKDDLNQHFYDQLTTLEPGWKNFYGASCQFAASDKSFYTNFCMLLNLRDSITLKSKTGINQ